MPPIKELPPQTLDEIKARLIELDDADAAINRAKLAGIDMAPQEKQSRELRQQLNRIKSVYYPGQ